MQRHRRRAHYTAETEEIAGAEAGTGSGVVATRMSMEDFRDAHVQVLEQGPDAASIVLQFVQQQTASLKAQLRDMPPSLGGIRNVNTDMAILIPPSKPTSMFSTF